jgi:hypothetical protein
VHKQEVHSVFISNISLPLTLTDRFGFTIFTIGYFEKGASGVRRPLGRESKKILLSFIHFKQAV